MSSFHAKKAIQLGGETNGSFFTHVQRWGVHVSKPQNPPEYAQPGPSRSDGSHHQRKGTSLGVFVPGLLVLPGCEATNLGVFDLCHFDLGAL